MKQLKDLMKYHNKKFFILFILVFFVIYYQYAIHRENPNIEEPTIFQVETGATLNGITERLTKDNLILNPKFAKMHAKLSGQTELYAGAYEIPPQSSIVEIVKLLSKPSQMETSITLTEGMWAKDMAAAIEAKTGIKKEKLLDLWNNKSFVESLVKKYDVITKEILKNKEVRILLEGYLYPDTYLIRHDATPEEITYQILDNTESKYAMVKPLIDKSDHSLHELVTLSSVVMFEASDNEDQKMVAGVFENRLKEDMPLQSSVTVCYVLYDFEDWEECELYENQRIESPYNTYLNKGLPIGPITNPDIKAIENTLKYKKHDYFYFVADVYEGGDGTVYYSKTFKEHEEKVEALRNR